MFRRFGVRTFRLGFHSVILMAMVFCLASSQAATTTQARPSTTRPSSANRPAPWPLETRPDGIGGGAGNTNQPNGTTAAASCPPAGTEETGRLRANLGAIGSNAASTIQVGGDCLSVCAIYLGRDYDCCAQNCQNQSRYQNQMDQFNNWQRQRTDQTANECKQLIRENRTTQGQLSQNLFCSSDRSRSCGDNIDSCRNYLGVVENQIQDYAAGNQMSQMDRANGTGVNWNAIANQGPCGKLLVAQNWDQIQQDAQNALQGMRQIPDQIEQMNDQAVQLQNQRLQDSFSSRQQQDQSKSAIAAAAAQASIAAQKAGQSANKSIREKINGILEQTQKIRRISDVEIPKANAAYESAIRKIRNKCLTDAKKEAEEKANAVADALVVRNSFKASNLMQLLGDKSGCQQNRNTRKSCYQKLKFQQCINLAEMSDMKDAQDARDNLIKDMNQQIAEFETMKKSLEEAMKDDVANAESEAKQAKMAADVQVQAALDEFSRVSAQEQAKQQFLGFQLGEINRKVGDLILKRQNYNDILFMTPVSGTMRNYADDFRRAQQLQSQVDSNNDQIAGQCCSNTELNVPNYIPDFIDQGVQMYLASKQGGTLGPNGMVNFNFNPTRPTNPYYDQNTAAYCNPANGAGVNSGGR